MTTTEIRAQVFKLPENERLKLAVDLLDSVEGGPAMRADDDPAWVAELERRAQRVADGETGLSWEEVRAQAEASLKRR
jgi:putative addiction module component (TIGR02574 family)